MVGWEVTNRAQVEHTSAPSTDELMCPLPLLPFFCCTGIYVLTTKLDQRGHVVPDKVIFHQGFIAHTCGDAPMRAKLLQFVGGFLAYLVCAYCRLCGVRKAGTMRYLGYVQPVTAAYGKGAGQSFQMGCDHDAGDFGELVTLRVSGVHTADGMMNVA